MRRLHERDGIRMLFEPRRARLEFHRGAAMTGKKELAVDVLVVDAHQSPCGATRSLRKIRDGVGVGAELTFLGRHRARIEPAGVGETTRIEIGRAGDKTVTPAGDDVVAIAVGDGENVEILRCDAVENAGTGGSFALCGNLRTGGESNGDGRAGDD